ncbi:MAG: hypothetical protein WCP21_19125, partial [Armatimonadota bacterium]
MLAAGAVLVGLLLPAIALAAPQWPFDTAEAQRRQQDAAKALGVPVERVVDLPGGGKLTLVLIPAGSFLMGSPSSESPLDPDESPPFRVAIPRPLWVGKFE